MAKEFFKNLPDTSTPLSAERLNGLLDGEESMGSITVEDIACKNLFDKNNALKGYELSSATGGTISNSTFYTSDYIEVIPGKKYYLTKSTLGSSNCFYDSNKNFISVISLQTGVLTIPDNSSIKYVRFNGSLSDIDNVQFEKGEVATDYVEHRDYGYTNSDLIKKLFNIPSERLRSTDNIDNFYNELGVKVYSIWEELPIGMPTGVYAYGTLISITQSTTSMFLNSQIYIPDNPASSGGETIRGVYFRAGQNNSWLKISGTAVAKTTN